MPTLMKVRRTCPALLLLAACMLSGTGCSREKIVSVKGKVTRNEQPVAGITVSFVPEGATETGVSSGTTDEQGQYELTVSKTGWRGAVVGTHKVWVSIPRKPEPTRKPGSEDKKGDAPWNPAGPIPADAGEILAKYGKPEKSPLTVEVKDGQPIDIKLD